MAAGASDVGVTTDEPTQLQRTGSWLKGGWFLPGFFLEDGEPSDDPSATPYVYGPAFSSLAHGANVLAGNESRSEVSVEKRAWTIRHLATALIALATALATGLALLVMTGSRRFALWTAAALLAIPIWTGMGMFNPKDIPVAAGYTFFTVGLVVALGRSATDVVTVRRGSGIAILIASGFFLGAGTRLALWLPLVLSMVTFCALVLLRSKLGTGSGDSVRFCAVGSGFLAGLIATILIYQNAFSEPLSFVSETLSSSSNYPYTGVTLTAGHLLSSDPPWWYLPAWTFASMPLLILSLAVLGGGSTAWSILNQTRVGAGGRLRALAAREDLGGLLVLQQVLLLSVGSVVTGAIMYAGLRQHLYMVPGLAILAGYGSFLLWGRVCGGPNQSGRKRAMVTLVLCAALLLPMAQQVFLFPFNYTYINPVVALGGINNRWETDYWWASNREILSQVPRDADLRCGFDSRKGSCAYFPTIAPYIGEQGSSVTLQSAQHSEHPWYLVRNRSGESIPPNCQTVKSVTRWVLGERVLMSSVVRCERADHNQD